MNEREKLIELLKKFKELNPWEGDVGERISKFNWLFKEMKKIYNMEEWTLICSVPTQIKFWKDSGYSYCDNFNKTINLQGRLSVITFLHEFAHALGMDQEKATEWSENLFKEVFSEKWANLQKICGLRVKGEKNGKTGL